MKFPEACREFNRCLGWAWLLIAIMPLVTSWGDLQDRHQPVSLQAVISNLWERPFRSFASTGLVLIVLFVLTWWNGRKRQR